MRPMPPAMVLCAGFGQRLMPLTRVRPKPLLPVLGRPLLDHILEDLARAGVPRAVLNAHHLAGQIFRYAEAARRPGFPIEVSLEAAAAMDTGGALREARALLGDGPVLVVNGDVLAECPLEELCEAHRRSEAAATLWMVPGEGPRTVAVGPAGDVRSFRESPGTGMTFAGIHVVEPWVIDRVPAVGPVSIIRVYERLLAEGRRIRAFSAPQARWHHVGSVPEYRQFHLRRLGPGYVCAGRGARVDPSAELRDTILWDRVTVEPGARLTGCIVADDARVGGVHAGEILGV